jgi:serine/threonine protein kinase
VIDLSFIDLSFIDLHGRQQTWQVKVEPESLNDGGDIHSCIVRSVEHEALKKWVPAEIAKQRPSACDSLENEAMVGYRLLDRFVGGHPDEIVEVHGHDLDAVEPFLLSEPPRGRQVKDVAVQLSLDEQDEFERGLFRALHCLAEVGIVHGDLSPHTVYWDPETATIQLGGFGFATLAGEPVPARAATPRIKGWVRPPVQRLAAHGDDIWAAGQLVLYTITGRADPTELSSRGPALRSLLDGVFADTPDARPHASVLLRRLSANSHAMAPRTAADERFEEGRRKFDETLARKQLPQRRSTANADSAGNTRISHALRLSPNQILAIVVPIMAALLLLIWLVKAS